MNQATGENQRRKGVKRRAERCLEERGRTYARETRRKKKKRDSQKTKKKGGRGRDRRSDR